MTSVWLVTRGDGSDGDPWDVEEIFSTERAAIEYAKRPGLEAWEAYDVMEWEVEGPLLAADELAALERATWVLPSKEAATVRAIIGRLS